MISIVVVVASSEPTLATREHGEAGEQDRLATPPVTDRADRQEQRGEGDRVAVDDPQQLALRGAEVDGQSAAGRR